MTPAPPTLFTAASAAEGIGQPMSDSATLSGGAHPTGTITFHVYGS